MSFLTVSRRVLLPALLLVSSLALSLSPFITSPTSAAPGDAYPTICTDTLNDGWKARILAIDSSFDEENDAYVIFQQTPTGSPATVNSGRYFIQWGDPGNIVLTYEDPIPSSSNTGVKFSFPASPARSGQTYLYADNSSAPQFTTYPWPFGASGMQLTDTGSSRDSCIILTNNVSFVGDFSGAPLYPGMSPNVYPKVGYTLDDRNLSALIYERDPIVANCSNNGVHWTLSSPTEVIDEQFKSIYDVYTYTMPGVDTYTLEAEYYSGVPCAPLPLNYIPTLLHLNVNGESVTGSTDLNSCTTTAGVFNCDEADPYADCSTYGTDVGGYVQCVIANFGVFLRALLVSLFVPPVSVLDGFYEQITTFMDTKLGFIYTSLASVVNMLTGMITSAATPDCVLNPPGTLFGSPVEFNLCTFEDNFPAAFAVMQTLVIGATVVGFTFAFYRKYNEVVDR